MFIDSHVNLHAPQFDEDRQEVIERARKANVGVMINICDRVSNFESCYTIAQNNCDIWATVGTHPHEARENPNLSVNELVALCKRPKVVGIGECGLDFHYDFSPRDIQEKIFRTHIKAAQITQLPLVVHAREADEQVWDILHSEFEQGAFKFLLHCYTSSSELAKKAADIGAWFSVSGIASFKAASSVRDVIKTMPVDKIIVETDCPYLAPIPMRGRRNEPAYVAHVYEKLAEIRGWSLDETIAITQDSFYKLFDKIPNNHLS